MNLASYIEKLLALHGEFVAGRKDGEAADKLRDEMDKPWHGLTEAEQRLVDRVSEALYVAEEKKAEKKQEDWDGIIKAGLVQLLGKIEKPEPNSAASVEVRMVSVDGEKLTAHHVVLWDEKTPSSNVNLLRGIRSL